MKNFALLFLAGISLVAMACAPIVDATDQSASGAMPEFEVVKVLMQTELGDVQLEIEVERAPVTAANFLKYVDEGFYDGGRFHRVVHLDNQPNDEIRIEVIQGSRKSDRERQGFGSIVLERTNQTGLKHVDGAISMARGGPDSASSDFFICINEQPSLDFGGMRNADGQGFGAFGKVIEGMDIVKKIQMSKTSAERAQSLDPAIGIIKMERMK